MRKLRLEIDSICVESFQVADAPAGGGTVIARGTPPVDDPLTIEQCDTYQGSCDVSCGGSCVASCDPSCYGTCPPAYTCGETYQTHCFPPAN